MGVVFDEVVAEVDSPQTPRASERDTPREERERGARLELRRLRSLNAVEQRRTARLEAD